MIRPQEVHELLQRHQLADGYSLVLDLERSHGSFLVDANTGSEFLDFFTCFASWPVGWNHPALAERGFQDKLVRAATHNPSNSDLYTTQMAEFVSAFATHATPPGFPYHFWVSGGALAVENALKVAFDWKARKIGLSRLVDDGAQLSVLHFRQAFHGRSGYTMSLTNTDPRKIQLFPKFPWPRVHNPAIEFDLEGRIVNDIEAEERRSCNEIEAAFRAAHGNIACILIEPMQSEGGDNHFRDEFLARLRRYADENECLLVLDEVQTGFFGSGKPWWWQHQNVRPDVVAFGKKTQVCGLYAGPRVDEVQDNVFHLPSRINSTWGGSLADMCRAERLIQIITGERLMENIATLGSRFIAGLRNLGRESRAFDNVRGRGSLVAFSVASTEARNQLLKDMREQRFLALSSGERSVRFRLPLTVSAGEVDLALTRIAAALPRSPSLARHV